MNYLQSKQKQTALRQFMASLDWDYFVTANFNRGTNIEGARTALKHWGARIDRKLLGKHWNDKEVNERMLFCAVPEHIHSNLHWHMMVRLPDATKKEHFKWIAANYWKQIVSAGSMDIQLINELNDKEKATAYSAKDLWRQENYDAFTISTEFSVK